jgi:carbonic anhydrase
VQTGKVHYKNYVQELRQLDGENNEQLAAKLKALLIEAKIET